MPTVIAYDVVSYSSKGTFVSAINRLISEGWQPLGPVVKYQNSDYYQTIVKYEQPKPNQI